MFILLDWARTGPDGSHGLRGRDGLGSIFMRILLNPENGLSFNISVVSVEKLKQLSPMASFRKNRLSPVDKTTPSVKNLGIFRQTLSKG